MAEQAEQKSMAVQVDQGAMVEQAEQGVMAEQTEQDGRWCRQSKKPWRSRDNDRPLDTEFMNSFCGHERRTSVSSKVSTTTSGGSAAEAAT